MDMNGLLDEEHSVWTSLYLTMIYDGPHLFLKAVENGMTICQQGCECCIQNVWTAIVYLLKGEELPDGLKGSQELAAEIIEYIDEGYDFVADDLSEKIMFAAKIIIIATELRYNIPTCMFPKSKPRWVVADNVYKNPDGSVTFTLTSIGTFTVQPNEITNISISPANGRSKALVQFNRNWYCANWPNNEVA